MRRIVALASACFFLTAGYGAFASPVEDAAMTARIETLLLLNEHLSPFDIHTATQNAVVTLSGSVDDQVQKDLAEELARSVDGVAGVHNTIVIVAEPVAAPEPKRGWRQRVSDATVSASVRSRILYHREFSAFNIDVRTRNGEVTLSGVVGTEDQKRRVAEIAAETRGVEKVFNNLSVHGRAPEDTVQRIGTQISDEWIEKRAETAILLNRHVRIRDLNVEVEQGVCLLTGTVDSAQEKEVASSIAANIGGVESVRNGIIVRPSSVDSAEVPAPSGPAPEELPLGTIEPIEDLPLAAPPIEVESLEPPAAP